jgi:hypothetical protein
MTGIVRRGGRLLELTERDTEREVLREAITIPASRVYVSVRATSQITPNVEALVPCVMAT